MRNVSKADNIAEVNRHRSERFRCHISSNQQLLSNTSETKGYDSWGYGNEDEQEGTVGYSNGDKQEVTVGYGNGDEQEVTIAGGTVTKTIDGDKGKSKRTYVGNIL